MVGRAAATGATYNSDVALQHSGTFSTLELTSADWALIRHDAVSHSVPDLPFCPRRVLATWRTSNCSRPVCRAFFHMADVGAPDSLAPLRRPSSSSQKGCGLPIVARGPTWALVFIQLSRTTSSQSIAVASELPLRGSYFDLPPI